MISSERLMHRRRGNDRPPRREKELSAQEPHAVKSTSISSVTTPNYGDVERIVLCEEIVPFGVGDATIFSTFIKRERRERG
jgi:hypothetical protein